MEAPAAKRAKVEVEETASDAMDSESKPEQIQSAIIKSDPGAPGAAALPDAIPSRGQSEQRSLEALYAQNADNFTNLVPAAQPLRITAQLMEHQRVGLAWLLQKESSNSSSGADCRGAILADDMGLGKTLMTLSLLAENDQHGATLIICPVSTVSHWVGEFQRFVRPGNYRFLTYIGNNRPRVKATVEAMQIVVTTYGVVTSENRSKSPVLRNIRWGRIILDEAHIIKNRLAQTAQAVRALSASHFRLCITGTPIQNDIEDLFSLLSFLRCPPYAESHSLWRAEIAGPLSAGRPEGVQRLQELTRKLLLRRRKDMKINGKPIIDIPPIESRKVLITLSAEELVMYRSLEVLAARWLATSQQDGERPTSYWHLLELLLRLRQSCNHPFLALVGSNRARYKLGNVYNTALLTSDWNKFLKVAKDPDLDFTQVLTLVTRQATLGACCALCDDDPVQPRTSKCGHVFCAECLAAYEDMGLICPRCGKVINIPEGVPAPTSPQTVSSLQIAPPSPSRTPPPVFVESEDAAATPSPESPGTPPNPTPELESSGLAANPAPNRSFGAITAVSNRPRPIARPKGLLGRFTPNVSRPTSDLPPSAPASPPSVLVQLPLLDVVDVGPTPAHPPAPVIVPTTSALRGAVFRALPFGPPQLPPSIPKSKSNVDDEDDAAVCSDDSSSDSFEVFNNSKPALPLFDTLPELMLYDAGEIVPMRPIDLSRASTESSRTPPGTAPAPRPKRSAAGPRKRTLHKRESREKVEVRPVAAVPDEFDGSAALFVSSKVRQLLDLLKSLRAADPTAKFVVYSQFVTFLDIVQAHLSENEIRFSRLDGSMTLEQRDSAIQQLRTYSDCWGILVSLKAGGVGINLTAASHVFLLDPWWNPMIEQYVVSLDLVQSTRAHDI